MRSNIIESSEMLDFNIFAATCGDYTLQTMIENLEQPIWVKITTDPAVPSNSYQPANEIQSNAPIFQQIFASQLEDGCDYTIRMDVTDATPAALAQEQQAFQLFNSLLVQFPHLAMDGDLIRETAFKSGYRNEKIIEKMQKAILVQQQVQQMLVEQQKAQGGGPNPNGGAVSSRQKQQNTSSGENPANAARAAAGQLATPGEQQITNQLSNQVQ